MKRRLFLVLAVLFLGGYKLSICAAEESFSMPPAKAVPVIDGKIDGQEWKEALIVYGALDRNGLLEPRPAVFYFTYYEEKLFFGIKSELPPNGRLVAQGKSNGKDVLTDDVWEIWLHPLLPNADNSS